jgi:antitoxin ParD1/3/4
MTISLTPEQQAQLSAYVARGDFSSVEEAASQFLDERIAERALEEGDGLVWAKPYVDEALEEVTRGNVLSHEEYRARVEAHLAKLKGK